MVENKYGNIPFFVGDGAYSGHGNGRAHLSAAKMALVGFVKFMFWVPGTVASGTQICWVSDR